MSLHLLQQCRKHIVNMATSAAHRPMNLTKKTISQQLQLITLQSDVSEPVPRGKERSLVIIFPFLQAKSGIMSHYCDLYHRHGHNVLLVNAQMKHFLWPPSGVAAAKELLDYLSSNELPLSTNNYHIHAFSIGAYLYTLVMQLLAKGSPKYASIQPKIRSQVFDSLTIGSFDNMSEGMTNSIHSPIAKSTIRAIFYTYLMLTRPYTKDFLVDSVQFFKDRPIRTPILLYYCLNDPMSRAEDVQQMLEKWEELKLDVHVKCWEKSNHAGHLRAHPEQYRKTLDSFLAYVDNKAISKY